jgi:CBS domain-containing protein
MKFALKTLVAAAAVASVGFANAAIITATAGGPSVIVTDPGGSGRQAELTLLSGIGGLHFSNGTSDPVTGTPTASVGGLVGALNVGDVVLAPLGGATVTETILPIGSRVKTDTRAKVRIDAGVSSLTADNVTGQINTVLAYGGASQSAVFKAGVLEGGTASITNLNIDLVNKRVYADLLGNAGEPYENNQPNAHLWDITTITGPTSIPPDALLAAGNGDTSQLESMGYQILSNVNGLYTVKANNVLSGLQVTQGGFDFFADALGLLPGSTGYTTLAGVNANGGWGSLTSELTFTVREVPEPSTYALMGVGLVGVALATRRRRAAK